MAMAVRKAVLNDVPEAVNAASYDETLAAFRSKLPDTPATLIADYAMQRFDEVIFGPVQWKTHWGATPVTASKEEEHPEAPIDLYRCLNNPVRPGEKLAGLMCTVTYIPQFVKRDDKVMAVTSRTIATVLGPNPKQGHSAKLTLQESLDDEMIFNSEAEYGDEEVSVSDDANDNLVSISSKPEEDDAVFVAEDANGTESPCYFVMERQFEPNTQRKKPADAMKLITREGWEMPAARNFIATVFSRLVWKGDVSSGLGYCFCKCKGQNDQFMAMGFAGNLENGSFSVYGVLNDRGSSAFAATSSRKFLPLSVKT